MQVCPLIFEPIYKPKIWGAQNLARLFGKKLPPDEAVGESWECADLEAGQSVVARGPIRLRRYTRIFRSVLFSYTTIWGIACRTSSHTARFSASVSTCARALKRSPRV